MRRKINSNFIIDLPFAHKRAVLTQARTHKDGVCPFIAEFDDGSRRFIKGPYKEHQGALKHVVCNEIKKILRSEYLHPIDCEVREYGDVYYLVCEELGTANLSNTEAVETKMDGMFEVLKYNSNNDLVPNPFKYLNEINDENKDAWVQIVVNYCFRWIFGIGDAAKRNLMLQRSTGKIYSTDEASIDSVEHVSIWNNQSPGKEVLSLVREFAEDEELMNIVINEVRRWKSHLRVICEEFSLNPANIEKRIDKFLQNPERVLVFVK